MRPLGVRDPEADGRPRQPRRVGRRQTRGRGFGQGPVDPATEPVPERGIDQGDLGDHPGHPPRGVQRAPARGRRSMPSGPGQVDRVDLHAGHGGPFDLRGGGRGRWLRGQDRQGHPAGRRGRLRRVSPPTDPPAQPRPGRVAQRLPRGLHLQDVGPLGPPGGDHQGMPGRVEDVGADDLLPLRPPDGVAPPDRPQLGRAVEVDLGGLGRQDVEGDRDRDRRAGLDGPVGPGSFGRDLDRIPLQPLHADLDARSRGGPLGTFQERGQRGPQHLPGDFHHQLRSERGLDPDPGPPFGPGPRQPRTVRSRQGDRAEARLDLDDPPFGGRDLGGWGGGDRPPDSRGEGGEGGDVPVDLDGHPDRRPGGARAGIGRPGRHAGRQERKSPGRSNVAPSCAHAADSTPGASTDPPTPASLRADGGLSGPWSLG